MEKELLQKALDSLLHGSTQVITEQDSYGNLVSRELRINDLRVPLIEKIADKLVRTEGFSQALEKAFTQEVLNKITEKMITEAKWNDLPYQLKQKLEKRMEQENVELKKFKLSLEVIDKN